MIEYTQQHSLKLFNTLISRRYKKTREDRLTEFLHDPEDNSPPDWFMYLPKAFNDCLDIQKTSRVEYVEIEPLVPGGLIRKEKITKLVWTQGSCFNFHKGCTIYDTRDAYQPWGEALKKIKYCLKINYSAIASPAMNNQNRDPGSVDFTLYKPNKKCAELIEVADYTLTQDEFILFLISGKTENLNLKDALCR